MAGSYPDPPGRRIPYDRDGSGVVYWDGVSVLTSLSAAQRQTLNDESPTDAGFSLSNSLARFIAVVFSQPMTIVGAYGANPHSGGGSHTSKFQYSLDTTTGLDGTWADMVAGYADTGLVSPEYRTQIKTAAPLPLASVKGVRFMTATVSGTAGNPRCIHLYGYRTTPAGNWLMLWHPTLDQPLSTTPAFYDLGDVARGAGPQVVSFRVKNAAAALTAQSVTVLREALTDGTPTVTSLTQLRYNGGAYGNTAAIGDLAPGAISSIVDAKLDVTALAPPGIWAPRVVATAASWV